MRRCLQIAVAVLMLGCAAHAFEIVSPNPAPPFTQVRITQSQPLEWITVDPILEVQQPGELSDDDIDAAFPELLLLKDGTLAFTGRPGRYVVRGRVDQNGVTVGQQKLVRILSPEPTPTPVPPTPPTPPTPDPTPIPTPPGPDTAPFPASGLTVMIVYETGQTNLPASQTAILSSTELRQFLNANTITLGADGKNRAWRMWDDDMSDTQLVNVPEPLRVAYRSTVTAANGRLPWIGISNGKTGTSLPLPLTIDQTIELIERFK